MLLHPSWWSFICQKYASNLLFTHNATCNPFQRGINLEKKKNFMALTIFFHIPLHFIFVFLVCKAKLDLGFVIDGSGSVGIKNFKRCLQFIKNMVRKFVLSRRFTRIGAVLYNTRAYKIFGFNRYGNKNQVLKAVSLIRYPRGGTKTGRALRYAYRYLFRRSKRRKVCMI